MTITICGSMEFHVEMFAMKRILEKMGHMVYIPKDLEGDFPLESVTANTNEERIAAKIEYDFIREHFRKINKSDAILVLNYEKKGMPNYIGGNTFLEMGIAFWLGKTIYLLHPVPDGMNYMTEMHAMQPVVLHGNIKKIGEDQNKAPVV